MVCLVSRLLIFLTQNDLEVSMSSSWNEAMETLLWGRIREGLLCFLRAARGMDWTRPGDIGCQVGTSIHPGLCHLSLLSALGLNSRACLSFLNSQALLAIGSRHRAVPSGDSLGRGPAPCSDRSLLRARDVPLCRAPASTELSPACRETQDSQQDSSPTCHVLSVP